ncbi:MAG TPA: inositol monophosphatase family protein, partial [Gemmatimonadaceae bacterium]|nr:inositol monophosphatase family protein [Gemmatimonadaceae bacterium]
MPSTIADQSLLDVAVAAARAAATVVRARADDVAALHWNEKRPADFVSEVDLAAEERIRETVARLLPSAVVAGEELSPDAVSTAGLVFVADPLDGTTNFLHGYPEFAVSVGVLCEGRLAAGVVINAATGEEWTALAGGGAWREGRRLAVSRIDEPRRALIGTGFPFKHP